MECRSSPIVLSQYCTHARIEQYYEFTKLKILNYNRDKGVYSEISPNC